MLELILLLGTAAGVICTGYTIAAILYYPFDRTKNGATLKQYLKELF